MTHILGTVMLLFLLSFFLDLTLCRLLLSLLLPPVEVLRAKQKFKWVVVNLMTTKQLLLLLDIHSGELFICFYGLTGLFTFMLT